MTISPLDTETILESVRKTQRAVVVHEAQRSFGPGAEIIARIQDKVFLYLKAPVGRVTGYDIHMPYFQTEELFLPDTDRVVKAVRETMNF